MAEVRLGETEFIAELERIVRLAEERNIHLRALGSVGIYYRIRHDPAARTIYLHRHGVSTGAPRFKDLDLASLEKYSSGIYKLFVRELHFLEDRETNALFGMYRNIYFHPAFSIDVFYDKLRFSHEVPLKGRFPPGVTLAPEDLFLGKAQIHQTTPSDLADLSALVLACPILGMDRTYLSEYLADDWGLWYDARENLKRAQGWLAHSAQDHPSLPREMRTDAFDQAGAYVTWLDQLPKTRRWEKRARRGTSEPWYEEVDEIR